MPKLFTIIVRCEELALGSTMSKLHEMPGIVDFGIDFGDSKGGMGPGAKRLAEAAQQNSRTNVEKVVELMTSDGGPLHVKDIAQRIGAKSATVSTVIYGLNKQGIVQSRGAGRWQIKAGAAPAQQMLALPAPAAPAMAAHGPKGRAKDGQSILIDVLSAAPVNRFDLRDLLSARGISATSTSGIVQRALAAKLIKRTGIGKSKIVELTEKGRKLIPPQASPTSHMNGVAAHHG